MPDSISYDVTQAVKPATPSTTHEAPASQASQGSIPDGYISPRPSDPLEIVKWYVRNSATETTINKYINSLPQNDRKKIDAYMKEREAFIKELRAMIQDGEDPDGNIVQEFRQRSKQNDHLNNDQVDDIIGIELAKKWTSAGSITRHVLGGIPPVAIYNLFSDIKQGYFTDGFKYVVPSMWKKVF